MARTKLSVTRSRIALPDASIYREELATIVDLMRQLSDDVTLKTNHETFTDIEHLDRYREPLPNFEISVGQRVSPDHMRVNLYTPRHIRREGNQIEIGNAVDTQLREIAEQVSDVVVRQKVRTYPYANLNAVGVAGIIMLFLMWRNEFDLSGLYLIAAVLYFLFVAYAVGAWAATKFLHKPGIYPYYRGNSL